MILTCFYLTKMKNKIKKSTLNKYQKCRNVFSSMCYGSIIMAMVLIFLPRFNKNHTRNALHSRNLDK